VTNPSMNRAGAASGVRGTTHQERPDPSGAYDPLDDVRAPGWEEAVAAGPVVPVDAPLAPEAVDGNLRRYARWQWRDFWQRRGFWMAGAAMLCVWMLVHWVLAERLSMGPGGQLRRVTPEPEEVLAISHVAFAVGGVLAGLLGVGGLVSRERERGLQRFLFAKPINIVRYYLQGFAVNGIGSVAVLAGAVLLAAVTAPPALAIGSMLAVAVGGYVLAGGVTFLVSTLWRFDAPVAGAYLAAGFPIVALAENGFRWAMPLKWLFPQGVALEIGKTVLEQRNPLPADITTMFLGVALLAALWGALCTVAGAVVLRRRAIST
jgi:hypothetical protein